jgi:hypothetical protein
MDRKTVALGVAAGAAVAAAVIVTVANGHGASPEHKAMASYIKSVDAIQQQMRVRLTKTSTAYRDFAHGKVDPKLAPELASAERTLQVLERRLVSLAAPPPAARLRRLLVQLARAQVALADEVTRLSTFVPTFGALTRRVGAAGTELSRGLTAVHPPKTHKIHGTKKQVAAAQAKFQAEATRAATLQADAIDSYDAKLGPILSKLRALRAPIVMQPGLRTQIRALEASRRAGAALAAELRKAKRSNVVILGRRFTIASRSATTVAAQKTQIASIKAYNTRVRAIGSLQASIQSELSRLQRVTG